MSHDTTCSALRILLVDDHAMVRTGVAAMLGSEEEFVVVGEAGTALAAIALIRELRPDIALVDVRIGKDCGIDLVNGISREFPEIHVIMLTSSDSGRDIRDALKAGASGYLLKNVGPCELHTALRQVVAGDQYLQEEIKPFLAEALEELPLTLMETEILSSLARGLTNLEIASIIGRSGDTVKAYLKGIFRKIGAANRAEAATIAVARRLTERR